MEDIWHHACICVSDMKQGTISSLGGGCEMKVQHSNPSVSGMNFLEGAYIGGP